MKTAKPVVKGSTFVEIPPNAARTLQALREMGYDSFSSIADLVDNSIDAGARKINITIKPLGDTITVDILDDGKGMDDTALAEALRLGSNVEEYDAKKRLGKFGMGLVTASLSMAQNIWVLSRAEGKLAYEATLDMDTIKRENKFVISLKPAKSHDVMETVEKHGTFVRLSKIDRVGDTNVSRFAQNLRTRIGQTYRHYIAQGITIMVNGRNCRRYDPLMLDHPEIDVKLDTTIELTDGTQATLKVVELPDLGTEGDAAANIYPHNSGFYVVRNGREIIAGETFGFYRHHHSYSHFRAELSYNGDSSIFHEDIKKSSIHPDDRFRDKLKKLTEKFIMASGRARRESGAVPVKLAHKSSEELIRTSHTKPAKDATEKAEPQEEAVSPVEFIEEKPAKANSKRFFVATVQNDKMIVAYNSDHPLVRYVSDANNPKMATLLDLLTFALAKAEATGTEGPDFVPALSKHLEKMVQPALEA